MEIRPKNTRRAIPVQLRGGDVETPPDANPLIKERRPRASDLPETATIIALDPGGTTGWSMMNFHPEALVPEAKVGFLENMEEWKHGEIDCGSTRGNLGTSRRPGVSTSGENSGAHEIGRFLRAWPGAAVVIEDFDLRIFNRDRDLLSPIRITDKVTYELWFQGREPFFQAPSRKPEASDERLKHWGLYQREGGQGHARDADRHAIIFARRCAVPGRQGRELREAAWPHLYGKKAPYHISCYAL